MARRYILGCDNCEHPIKIEVRQAGQVINCPSCQNSVTIGTLREIRALPEEAEPDGEDKSKKATGRGMSPTNRLLFVIGALMLVLGAVWGGYTALKSNSLMRSKPAVRLSPELLQAIDDSSPASMLGKWENVSIAATDQWREHPFLKLQRVARENRIYSWIGFSIAGLGLVLVGAAFLLKL